MLVEKFLAGHRLKQFHIFHCTVDHRTRIRRNQTVQKLISTLNRPLQQCSAVLAQETRQIIGSHFHRAGSRCTQTIRKVADELVMYEQAGVIINRVPDESIVQYMDLGDLPVLSVIPSDSSLAEFDLKGENVFYLSDDAAIVRGAREALKKLEIL